MKKIKNYSIAQGETTVDLWIVVNKAIKNGIVQWQPFGNIFINPCNNMICQPLVEYDEESNQQEKAK